MAKRSLEEEDIDLENGENTTISRSFAVSKRANKFIKLKVPYSGGRYYHRNNELSRGAHSIVYKLFNEDETSMFAGKRLITNGTKALKLKVIDELEMYKLICKKKHPNIIQLNESFQLPNHNLYMVLEYANNGTLQDILQYRGRLPELETKPLILQMCGGVHWLHSNHIIHGDLKLGNILIHNINSIEDGKYDMVKICDFGHSFINNGSKNYIDQESDIMGTPYYLAPEVIYRYRGINISGKTIPLISFPIDIWSIGVILFTMLFGCNPFITNEDELHSLSMNDLMYRITSNTIKLPSSLANQITPLCKDVLLEMLRQHPFKRISLLEIVNHEWLKTGFSKNVELLNPNAVASLDDINYKRSLEDYIAALKQYGFSSLMTKPRKSQEFTALLENLKHNAKKAKKKLLSQFHNNHVHIDPVVNTNEISQDTSRRIIMHELQVTLRNMHEIELKRKNASYSMVYSNTAPILITKRNILNSQINYGIEGKTFMYQLSNGQSGFLFDGNHSMLLNDTESLFWYIIPDEKSGWISKCFPQDIDREKVPAELAQRLQFVNDCKLDMELNNASNENEALWYPNDANLSYNATSGDTFLRRYAIFGEKNHNTSSIEICFLSDRTYQFNFKKDQITILLQSLGHQITILDSHGRMFTDSYYNLLWGGNQNGSGDLKGMLIAKSPIIKEILKRQMANI